MKPVSPGLGIDGLKLKALAKQMNELIRTRKMTKLNKITQRASILLSILSLSSCLTAVGPNPHPAPIPEPASVPAPVQLKRAVNLIKPTKTVLSSECVKMMKMDSTLSWDRKRLHSIYFSIYDDLSIDTAKFMELDNIWKQVQELDTLFYSASRNVSLKKRHKAYIIDQQYLDSLRRETNLDTFVDKDSLFLEFGCVECSTTPILTRVEQDGDVVEKQGIYKTCFYPRDVNMDALNTIVLQLPYRLQRYFLRCGSEYRGGSDLWAWLDVEKKDTTLVFTAHGGMLGLSSRDTRTLVAEVGSGNINLWRERGDGKKLPILTKHLDDG